MSQSQDQKQSVLSHLAALRKMLVISAAVIAAAFVLVLYFAADMLMQLLLSPITAKGIEVIYTAMSEALMTKMKVSFIAAVVLASPVVLWQIWAFIKPEMLMAGTPNNTKTRSTYTNRASTALFRKKVCSVWV